MDAEFMMSLIDAYSDSLAEEIRHCSEYLEIAIQTEGRMMDADNRIIPYVDDDQGEGVKDPLTMDDLLDLEFNPDAIEGKQELFKHLVKKEFKKNQPETRWLPCSKGPGRGRDRR